MSLILFFSLVMTPIPAWESVQERFRDMTEFEVSFRQEIKQDILADKPEPATGKIFLDRDDELKFRWVYESPDQREIYFDGKEWWMIEDGKTSPIPRSDQFSLDKSFSFLWGGEHPDLNLKPLGQSRFEVRPSEPADAGFKKIVVSVEDSLVKEAVLFDLLEGESHYQFHNWKIKGQD